MLRREGQQGIQPTQGFALAQPRGFDFGQIQIGVHQLRIELDGMARGCRGLLELPLRTQQERQVAMRFGIAGVQCQRLPVVKLRAFQTA